jgi:hypothetical protein
VETYYREKCIQLGLDIAGRKKIYLDTNFWVHLGDVRMGRPRDEKTVELLRLLEVLVREGIALCPITVDTFLEIFKQTDPNTLRATVQLVDELSEGVVISELHERIGIEIFHFVREKTLGPERIFPLAELVWTRIAYLFGFCVPRSEDLSTDENTAVQKASVDDMWTLKVSDLLHQGWDQPISSGPRFFDSVEELNKGKFAHLEECKSFKELFLAELAGLVDSFRETFEDLTPYTCASDTGERPTPFELLGVETGQALANLVYQAFRQNRMTTEVPSIRVWAGLHAAVRWDAGRRYKPNDLHDFHHAVAAIPYFDYFLTDNSLRHLVGDKNLGLSLLFTCQTVSRASDAVSALSQLDN